METQSDAYLSLAKSVISTHAQSKNLVISPLSIHILLAMTVSGSSGPTRAQLLSYLNSESSELVNSLFSRILTTVLTDGSPLGGPALSTANRLWIDQSVHLNPAYRDIVQNSYKAVDEEVDFQFKGKRAVAQVNAWAENQTNGLIKQMIPDTDTASIRLIMANAVYFKGAWAQEFDASRTSHHNFYLLDDSSTRAPFMTSGEMQQVCAFDGFKVLKIPYARGEGKCSFSMYIYLPNTTDGLPHLLNTICSDPDFINRHLPNRAEELADFRVPLFKIAFEFDAALEVMKGLGVVDLFEEGLTETFDDPILGRHVFVSRMLHRAFIEVNKRGAVGAAVTEVEEVEIDCGLTEEEVKEPEIPCSWMEDPLLEFVADHPFVFVIREDTTGELLFVGQLLDPLA